MLVDWLGVAVIPVMLAALQESRDTCDTVAVPNQDKDSPSSPAWSAHSPNTCHKLPPSSSSPHPPPPPHNTSPPSRTSPPHHTPTNSPIHSGSSSAPWTPPCSHAWSSRPKTTIPPTCARKDNPQSQCQSSKCAGFGTGALLTTTWGLDMLMWRGTGCTFGLICGCRICLVLCGLRWRLWAGLFSFESRSITCCCPSPGLRWAWYAFWLMGFVIRTLLTACVVYNFICELLFILSLLLFLCIFFYKKW